MELEENLSVGICPVGLGTWPPLPALSLCMDDVLDYIQYIFMLQDVLKQMCFYNFPKENKYLAIGWNLKLLFLYLSLFLAPVGGYKFTGPIY